SIAIRHNKQLEGAAWFWDAIRPLYNGLMRLVGRRGLHRTLNGTDPILVSAGLRGVSETYEPEVWRSLMAEVQRGDKVADIGTYVGLYTVALAKRVGASGRVFAFEPNAATFALLRSQITLNGVDDRVQLFQAAVGEQNKLVKFEANFD